MHCHRNYTVIIANMLGDAEDLRASARGRASFTMQVSHYAPVLPPDDDEPFPPAVGMRA
jgi:translation elongation factor EF-G